MRVTTIIAIFVLFAGVFTVDAQEEGIAVNSAVICTDVEDREPVGVDTEFSAGTGSLYCHTAIDNPGDPATVKHVWYYGGEMKAEVELSVGTSANWRTWSSKTLLESWTGDWKVEIVGPGGEILKTLEFTVTE